MKGQAVHFGAGSIGRGFLGQIYCESGYHTTFIDVVPSVVNALNERGNYPLHIVSDTGMETTHITDVSAISGTSLEDAAAALARADIASTAVGLHALPHIAPVIARAVALRFENKDAASLDILICENLKDGEAHVRGLVAGHLAPSLLETLETRVGFIEASIGRMVPVITPEQRAEDPLAVWVEPYCELPVDA
ncbi:MAG TPA: mannitol-1-phosphate 5-dehydrogenase, partial [Candidatus Hydrogenedentes bacterium]|nr:mannitol-1-phosphate 5-dehydrogenase [Candidatus Hydrogenedentota bacterium]